MRALLLGSRRSRTNSFTRSSTNASLFDYFPLLSSFAVHSLYFPCGVSSCILFFFSGRRDIFTNNRGRVNYISCNLLFWGQNKFVLKTRVGCPQQMLGLFGKFFIVNADGGPDSFANFSTGVICFRIFYFMLVGTKRLTCCSEGFLVEESRQI